MKLPNGFGSVYKLSGHRRNPWCARKTVGWKDDPASLRSFPVYKFIGFYPTRQEAMQALADYNAAPYDLLTAKMTLAELYDKWSEQHFEQTSQSNIKGIKAAWKLCDKIQDMQLSDLKLIHFQTVCDESGKNAPTLKKLKSTLGMMYDYAVIHEIVTKDKRDMIRYIDIKKAGNPNALDRTPFNREQIATLWNYNDSNPYISTILILIYTGLRVSELLQLEKSDVHLDEQWFYVRASKTESGIREVPIADKIVPIFAYWLSRNGSHLICSPTDEPFTYQNYYDSYWQAIMKELNMSHRPHDTRHTCISLLTEAGVDARIIKKIVGHKGQGVTETVYTHLDLQVKLDAINRI